MNLRLPAGYVEGPTIWAKRIPRVSVHYIQVARG
jgi:hypothetical protein